MTMSTPVRRPPHGGRAGLRVAVVGSPLTVCALKALMRSGSGSARVVAEYPGPAATTSLVVTLVDVVVVEAATIVDADDLGWARRLLTWPDMPRVLLMTGSAQDETKLAALAPTPALVIDRAAPLEEVLRAVYAAGGALAAAALRTGRPPQADREVPCEPPRPVPPLTAREGQVLGLLAQGRTNAEIGSGLSLSETTVKFHVRSLLRKFQANRRTHLAYLAGRRQSSEEQQPVEPRRERHR